MADQVSFTGLGEAISRVVRSVMDELRPALVEAALTGNRGERPNKRHQDNFLSSHDLRAHNRYRQLISPLLPMGFVYASEEAEPQVIGEDADPDLCVLVDPLDTSELAVRALNGYTHVLIYSRSLRRPVVAVVGDIYHHVQTYIAFRDDDGHDRASVTTRDGDIHPIRCEARAEHLSQALVTNYLMRPAERFEPLAAQHEFLHVLATSAPDGQSLGRIGVDFGSVSLCHVAAGFTDAMTEFAKGFAIWDLAPGHYILHAAGGTILELDGKPLTLDYDLTSLADINDAMALRQKFIAAANPRLATQIVSTIRPH